MANNCPIGEVWSQADWSQARGLGMIDYCNFIMFVRSSVEAVAGAIAEEAEVWERDVIGREILFGPESLFVYRLRDHPWAAVLTSTGMPLHRDPNCAWEERLAEPNCAWGKRLSLHLRSTVVLYDVSDTCSSIKYTRIEAGKLVELFDSEPTHSTKDDIDIAERFFVEHDLFDPGIDFEYFFDGRSPILGHLATVRNPGFPAAEGRPRNVPEFERVDFLALRQGEARR